MEQLTEESCDYLVESMQESPYDKRDSGTMPKTAYQECNDNVDVCAELAFTVSAERYIDIIAQP